MESPRMVRLTRVVDEARGIKTLLFNHRFERVPVPGQFLMVWLPGVDEIPLALSYITVNGGISDEHGVTVAAVGEATEQLHRMGSDSWLGIRGPYGTGFELGEAKSILVVGGGIGMAPLAPAVDSAVADGRKVTAAIGARTADELLFVERMKRIEAEVMLSTDDGSEGHKGFVTELAEDLLKRDEFELVLGCGPELMLTELVKICSKHDVPVQISLERYMKCGVGICDSCALDGFHVCKDGPVFPGELISETADFGKYKREPSGRRIKI